MHHAGRTTLVAMNNIVMANTQDQVTETNNCYNWYLCKEKPHCNDTNKTELFNVQNSTTKHLCFWINSNRVKKWELNWKKMIWKICLRRVWGLERGVPMLRNRRKCLLNLLIHAIGIIVIEVQLSTSKNLTPKPVMQNITTRRKLTPEIKLLPGPEQHIE